MRQWQYWYVVLLSVVVTSMQHCQYVEEEERQDTECCVKKWNEYGFVRKIICRNVTLASGEELQYKIVRHQTPTNLEIRYSNINQLPAGVFAQFSFITILKLPKNGIKYVQIGAFNSLYKVEELYINNNQMSKINQGVFNALNNLVILDVSFNNIQEIEKDAFTGLKKLEKIILKSNGLTCLSEMSFTSQKQLKFLDLSDNALQMLPAKLLNSTSLKQNPIKIDLSNNSLRSLIDFANNTKYLKLNKNTISEINVSLPLLALEIDLSHNVIKRIELNSFSGLKHLRILNLTHNLIEFIAIGSFKDLNLVDTLDLSVNNLTQIGFGLLHGLHNLKTLKLGTNHLKQLSGSVFYETKNLESLDISNNQLHSLVFNHFVRHFKKLRNVTITGNNFECESLVQFAEEFENSHINVLNGTTHDKPNVYGIPCKTQIFTEKEADHGQDLTEKAISKSVSDELKIGNDENFGVLLKSLISKLENIHKEMVKLKYVKSINSSQISKNLESSKIRVENNTKLEEFRHIPFDFLY